MWATALMLFGLGHAADGIPAERGAFGEWQDGATVVFPRAALAHLVAAGPVPFAEDGMTLRQDASGLLGAMGLKAGDRLVLNGPAEDAVASWFGATEVSLGLEGGGVTVRFEGPPVDPPRGALTGGTATGDARPEPVVAVHRDDGGVRIDRGALVHLVAGTGAVPVRSGEEHVGYRLQGPLFDALDLPDPVASIGGRPLIDDGVLFDALDGWFGSDEVVVVGVDGAAVHVWIDGPAVAPPAMWTIPVTLDLAERRLRAGVRLSKGGATVPREALADLLEWRGVRRRGARPDDPPTAQDLLRSEMADLLGVPREAVVLAVGEVRLARLDEVPGARRVLLVERRVRIEFGSDGPEKSFVLRIVGEPLNPPDGWPDVVAPAGPVPIRGVRHEAGNVTAGRLVIRRLLATWPGASALTSLDGRTVAVIPDVHPLWAALGVPSVSRLVALDGVPVTSPEQVSAWAQGLCSADGATVTWSQQGIEGDCHLVIDGPPVRCP